MSTPRSVQTNRSQKLRLGLLIALISLALVLVAWSLKLFTNGQLWMTNSFFVADERSADIVIVGLDNESLARYGRAPVEWPRSLYTVLIDILNEGGARVIAFDLLFAEATPDDENMANALLNARQSDTRTRTVLAASGARDIVTTNSRSITFEAALHPVDTLAGVADYVAYVNTVADVDGMLRRQASFITIGEEPQLSFPLATYLAYLRIPSAAVSQLVLPDGDELEITPERRVAVDHNGLWVQNFFGAPGKTFSIYPIQAVLAGEVPPETFSGKIVLVGLTEATGVMDRYPVPSASELMPGVEIQAHAVETLLRNAALHEQPALSQVITFVVLTGLVSLVYTQVNWMLRVALVPVFMIAMLTTASINFGARHEITNLLYASLSIILPAIISLGVDTTVEINKRRRAELLLESVVDVANQQMNIEKVLARIATDVQRMIDTRAGLICHFDETGNKTHSFGDQPALDAIGEEVRHLKTTIVRGTQIAVPVMWQQHLVGLIAVERKSVQRIDRQLLEDLAQRIAPGLENVRLYGEVQRQKQTLEAVLYGSPSFNILLDDHLDIVMANRAFLKWREGEDNITGNPLLDLLTEIEGDVRQQLVADFGRRHNFQSEIRIGSQTFNLFAAYLSNDRLWVVILSDVSALAELSRLKTHMIRMASHDLKNPLGAVLGYADLMLMDHEHLTDEHQRFIKTIRLSGEVMRNIIEDILNLEQLRAEDTPQEDVNLGQLATEVISRHEPEIEGKGQTLTVEIAPDLPQVRGRPVQLSQVVTNLLGNAVKYTPDKGKVWLRLYRCAPDKLRLEVQDTGYGIPKEAQSKLFTEFYRVKTRETAHISGTGLGLSLVKSVVEAHQGRIWVESEKGQGSTFFVELPTSTSTGMNL